MENAVRFSFVALAAVSTFILKEPKRGAFEKGMGDLVRAGYTYPKVSKFEDHVKLVKVKINFPLFLQGIAETVLWGAIPYFLVEFFRREKSVH